MLQIDSSAMSYRELNDQLRLPETDFTLINCCGQRFLAAGMANRSIAIYGVPGNALGAYLNGARVTVYGNAQEAVGDTMNEGEIVIYGSAGDAAGYAMRGGRIFIQGDAGYRAGIHMKAYEAKAPVMIIGGRAGSFLGEYQAGGIIAVLGLDSNPRARRLVGNFPCTGMHGGKLFLRGDVSEILFPQQVQVRPADEADFDELQPHLEDFCSRFGVSLRKVMDAPFTVVTPDSKNPYKQMYVAN